MAEVESDILGAMRTLILLASCLGFSASHLACAAAVTAEELLALDGKELQQASAELAFEAEASFSTANLIAIAAKLAPLETSTPGLETNFAFSRFFNAACDRAHGPEVEKLIAVYVALDPDSFSKNYCFSRLAEAWLARELATRSDFRRIALPALQEPVPETLADASPEEIDAWSFYSRAIKAAEPLLRWDRQSEHVSFQRNSRAFFSLIDDALHRRGDDVPEKLARFEWSGWSGTGSDSLREPQRLGILLALLTEDRFEEAAGVAIEAQSGSAFRTTNGRANPRIGFLEKCGLDWELIFAGAVSAAGDNAFELHDPLFLEGLAGYGSERAALLLMQIATRATGRKRIQCTEALSAFIPGSTDNLSIKRSGELERYALPISDEISAEVLKTLQKFATPDAPEDLLIATLTGFARAKAESTKPTLRALLEHHSDHVKKSAADVLRSLGEEVTPLKHPPVRFQIFVNGAPLQNDELVICELWTDGNLSRASAPIEDGVISIDRKLFDDHASESSRLILSQRDSHEAETPFFRAELPVPTNLDELLRLDVQTHPVELRIMKIARGVNDNKLQAEITIQRHDDRVQEAGTSSSDNEAAAVTASDDFDSMERSAVVPVEQLVHLSMQPGRYDLEVSTTGARPLKKTFNVETETTKMDVTLEPAGDLRFVIIRPDGERGARFALLHEGQELELNYKMFDVRSGTLRGLAPGNYILRVPSSAEIRATEGPDFAPITAYAGRDVAFVITGTEDRVIDLGEIRLEATH